MTKRFTLEDNYIYDYDMRLSMRDLVEMLNAEEDYHQIKMEECEKLRKDNEKLQERVSLWEMTASNDRLKKQELLKQVDSLIKENLQLQQDVDDSETKNTIILGITLIAFTIIILIAHVFSLV